MIRCYTLLAVLPTALLLIAAGPAKVATTPELQVQVADSGPLNGLSAPSPVALPKKILSVTPAGLEPAPVPDPDAGGPLASGGLTGASLAPAFFSQKAEYAGDGFVGRSSADETTERRRQPAAGFNLSVPVQQ
jgi:hypothetical protein